MFQSYPPLIASVATKADLIQGRIVTRAPTRETPNIALYTMVGSSRYGDHFKRSSSSSHESCQHTLLAPPQTCTSFNLISSERKGKVFSGSGRSLQLAMFEMLSPSGMAPTTTVLNLASHTIEKDKEDRQVYNSSNTNVQLGRGDMISQRIISF